MDIDEYYYNFDNLKFVIFNYSQSTLISTLIADTMMYSTALELTKSLWLQSCHQSFASAPQSVHLRSLKVLFLVLLDLGFRQEHLRQRMSLQDQREHRPVDSAALLPKDCLIVQEVSQMFYQKNILLVLLDAVELFLTLRSHQIQES